MGQRTNSAITLSRIESQFTTCTQHFCINLASIIRDLATRFRRKKKAVSALSCFQGRALAVGEGDWRLEQKPCHAPIPRIRPPTAAGCGEWGRIFRLRFLATNLIHQTDELVGGLNPERSTVELI